MTDEMEKRPVGSTEPMSEEAKRRQRMRSWAIAGALMFLVFAFYAATIVRLGGNVMSRPL